MTKICSLCKVEKPISDFWKDASKPDGHRPRCVVCEKKWHKGHYDRNVSEMRSRKRIYYKDNRDTILEQNKEKYQENRESILKEQKDLYHSDSKIRKRKIQNSKEYREKHPNCRKFERFTKRAKDFGYSKEGLLALYDKMYSEQEGCCAICCKPMEKYDPDLCLDHNKFNMQVRGLLCKSCNFAIGLLQHSAANCFRAMDYLSD